MIEDVFWRFGLQVGRVNIEVRRELCQTSGTRTAESTETQEAAPTLVHHVSDAMAENNNISIKQIKNVAG